jgi:hypothetical protein
VPLVKAVQELDENQKSEVKSQNEKITALQKENNELKERLTKLETIIYNQQSITNNQISSNLSTRQAGISSASLEQNIPNPFNHTTAINYTLPQQYLSAKIIVYDEAGKTIKSINLSGTGKGSMNFSAPFRAGASYQYSLYVDGRLMGTKQMILSK